MNKVLFACLKYDYGRKERGISIERKAMLPAFVENKCDVVEFWLEENGFPDNLDLLQTNLIEAAEKSKPNLIFFVLMNYEIRLSTLDYLKERFTIINWFCDDQWRFDNYSKFVAPHLTYSITVDKYSLDKYRKINCNAILSQWAPIEIDSTISENEYRYDVSFVGSWNPTREWIISSLRKNGIKVECFGSGWGNGRVSYSQMREIFHTSKINLNLSNSLPNDFAFRIFLIKSLFISLFKGIKKLKIMLKCMKYLFTTTKNVEQLKARIFEIPGYNGFLLSQYTLSIEDFYCIGKEIAIFTNIEELVKSIHYFLVHDAQRESIRKAGFYRTQSYTYSDYIKDILSQING